MVNVKIASKGCVDDGIYVEVVQEQMGKKKVKTAETGGLGEREEVMEATTSETIHSPQTRESDVCHVPDLLCLRFSRLRGFIITINKSLLVLVLIIMCS